MQLIHLPRVQHHYHNNVYKKAMHGQNQQHYRGKPMSSGFDVENMQQYNTESEICVLTASPHCKTRI